MSILNWITVQLLKRYEPGYLPEPIFFEMCRLNTLVSVEVILDTPKKIFLVERDDKYFGNVWHLPGTMVRGNEDINKAFLRLVRDELPLAQYYVQNNNDREMYFKATPRGNILHVLIKIKTKNRKVIGQMKFKNKLPENVLDYHKPIIERL